MGYLYSYPKENGLYGIFNDSFPPIIDGVTLTVENYAYWISRRGETPCIVTPWNPEKVVTPYHVMRYLSLPIQNRHPYRYGYPKLDPFIWKRLKNTQFKILHSHCPFSSGRLAVYVKKHQKIPLIGTFHSKYKEDLQHSFRHFPFCVPIIMKRILNFFNACDEVWIPQKDVEETVRKYGYKGPLTVVENGNDFASLIVDDVRKYKLEAKKRIGFDVNDFNLLFVGQHIWEKGLNIILQTIEQLKEIKSIKINFIGDGYASGDINKLVKEKGLEHKVKLNGLITDRKILSDFYAASDLFFFPSMYDNAPLVVREAAAMATPSLLLKGSTASEVIEDSVNGYLVDNNIEEISSIIKYLVKERENVLKTGIKARNSLVRSWEDVVGEVMDRYDVAIRKQRR
ncbi:MAG: glycosyltransferase [Muribaculaceae bacterium]|nr:glycosyltransferase [Muribaculaceae bacterium]